MDGWMANDWNYLPSTEEIVQKEEEETPWPFYRNDENLICYKEPKIDENGRQPKHDNSERHVHKWFLSVLRHATSTRLLTACFDFSMKIQLSTISTSVSVTTGERTGYCEVAQWQAFVPGRRPFWALAFFKITRTQLRRQTHDTLS